MLACNKLQCCRVLLYQHFLLEAGAASLLLQLCQVALQGLIKLALQLLPLQKLGIAHTAHLARV